MTNLQIIKVTKKEFGIAITGTLLARLRRELGMETSQSKRKRVVASTSTTVAPRKPSMDKDIRGPIRELTEFMGELGIEEIRVRSDGTFSIVGSL